LPSESIWCNHNADPSSRNGARFGCGLWQGFHTLLPNFPKEASMADEAAYTERLPSDHYPAPPGG